MATVCVGSLNELSVCRVETDSTIQGIDDPKYVEFNIPSETTSLEPGSPKWANYVKGVIAGFHGMRSNKLLFILDLFFGIDAIIILVFCFCSKCKQGF